MNKSFETQLSNIVGKGNKQEGLIEIKEKSSFRNLYKVIKKVQSLPEGKEFENITKMVYENHVK